MLTLRKKLGSAAANSGSGSDLMVETNNNNINNNNPSNKTKVSIRDKLLVKELADLVDSHLLPQTVKLNHPDPDKLHEFTLTIAPEEGYWGNGGVFLFTVNVTEEYNFAPPLVRCQTPLWHPNITEDGSVCLSLLRQSSIDELGWAPTRTIKDVVWGVNSLFTDLLNFEDPLNTLASDQFQRSPAEFEKKVKDYITKYCKK